MAAAAMTESPIAVTCRPGTLRWVDDGGDMAAGQGRRRRVRPGGRADLLTLGDLLFHAGWGGRRVEEAAPGGAGSGQDSRRPQHGQNP